ncbi:hypothetical protein ABDK56_07765 [Sphingomonas sp. ASV193]|uniref:hypothetical protein n=1 Tax=Sphingomonas sp. ASV193 TaxID=3144405 RepID=UPI0032E92632
MTESTLSAQAERLSRRRARMLPVLAIFYLAQQAAYFSQTETGRPVDHVRVGAWVMMSAVLLLALVTGGFWLRSREVRAMLDDESTRAHRASAIGTGFLFAMAVGIGLYPFVSVLDISAQEAIHLIVSFGIAAALIRFGMLERRAAQ